MRKLDLNSNEKANNGLEMKFQEDLTLSTCVL